MKYWRIVFASGFIMDLARKVRPTQLAKSWAKDEGEYSIYPLYDVDFQFRMQTHAFY